MKAFIAVALLLCSLVFARAANPSGSGTNNLVPKWTGSLTLGSSTITNTTSAIGLGNGSLAGTTLSGSSDVVAIGETALQTSAFTNSSSIFVIGSLADVGASNLFGFYGLGISGGGNSLFRDSSQIVWLGDSLFDSTTVTNSSDLIGIGHSIFNSSVVQSGTDLFGIGHFSLSSAVITNSQDIFGYGYGALFAAKVTNSSQIYGYGDSALDHAKVSASSEVYAYGDGALETSTLTNVSDIYAFGTSAGSALSLSGKSHIFMLGSGAQATNSNDYVFGNSAYNYFFPGASARFAATPTVNGVPVLTNASGTTVSVNGTNVTTPNFTNTATVTLAVSGSNIMATAIVPAGTATASGTANTVAKFTSSTNLGNSSITDNGTTVALTSGITTVAGTQTNTATAISQVPFVAVGASGQTNDLMQWMASAGTNYSKVNSNGQFLLQRGSQTNPSLGFLEDADGAATGLFRQAADTIGFTLNGTERVRIASSGALHTTFFAATSDGAYGFTSSTSLGGGYDTQLSRDAAAVFQMGADAATPVNQALKAADGSGTDKAGANFTLEGGQGTGTGAGGTLLFATSKARTTASTVNPYTNWMSIDSNGFVAISNVTGTATSLAGFTSSNTVAAVGIGSGLAMSGTNLTATGTFTGILRDFSIEPGAMFPAPTAATLTQYTNSVNETLSDAWVFADAATQATRFAITLPDVWNVGTVKLKLYVTSSGTNVATTTNLVWGVKAGSLAPLEALTNAVFGTQVFVTNGLDTVGNVMQVFTTPAITVGGSPAVGDSLWFDISRQGSNGSDTWTNTVLLLKARLQYTESSTAPSAW